MIRPYLEIVAFLLVAPVVLADGGHMRAGFLAASDGEGGPPIGSLAAGGSAEESSGAPMGKGALAAQGGAPGGKPGKNEKKGIKKGQKFKSVWLSFDYWKPLLASMAFLMLVVDVGGPLLDTYCAFNLQTEVCLLAVSIYGFAMVVIYFMDKKAAGMKNLLAVATIGCTMTLLMVIGTLSMTLRKTKKNNPMWLLATDVATLVRPTLHCIMCAVLLDVVATEANVDWGQMAVLLGFFMLGIALSLSGVIGDILAHVFLRMDNHFVEGDFIIYDGGLVQIIDMKWRHTIGITDDQNAVIYIPNSELTAGAIVNQSQDSDRCVEVDILVNMDAEKLEKAVNNAWELFRQTEAEDFKFTGLDGNEYTNQFNTPECLAYVKETADAVHIVFTGNYYFSNPPPFDGEEGEEEPEANERQQDWEQGWQMQVEWFNIQLKKMNESLGDWPYYPESWRV